MPESITKTWSVTAPDGTDISFSGPKDMTPDAVIQRAQQEYAFKTGKIPTTYEEGRNRSIGETLADQSKPISAAIGLTGAVTGQPEVVAAAPLAGRAIKAAGEYVAGRPITPTSAGEVATLAAEGAVAGYGPQAVSKGLEWGASRVLAHQLPSGQWVKGIQGSGVMPWAIRTAGEAAGNISNALYKGSKAFAAIPSAVNISESTDVLAGDLKTMMDAVRSGSSPSVAASKLANGNPQKYVALMTSYTQAQGK